MELVGRPVTKVFEGFGTFAGVVESYDPSAGYFRILYEDGDSEEVDFEEITAILGGTGEASPAGARARRSGRGRRPKKRRRSEADLAGYSLTGRLFDRATVGTDPNLGRQDASLMQNGYLRANCDQSNVGSMEIVVVTPSGFGETPRESKHLEENSLVEGTKKRQKVSGKRNLTQDAPLRRSSRKVKAPVIFSQDYVPLENISRTFDDAAFGAEQPCLAIEDVKRELPPPSNNLDVDGLPVLDVFSVYSCLRSFSRLLFLSPFRLETFVGALRCRYANSLIDCIHFSILEALKRHLESLSQEGSRSAACCLRSLNWDLLDSVTWPVFLTEYLLTRGAEMRSGIRLSHLKLLDAEYYKQPAAVKLEILSCLCDDVIEVEDIRSELNKRMMEPEFKPNANHMMDVDKKLKVNAAGDPRSSALDQQFLEEAADGNIDECCLCRMDGNLICCDGCPAAFHSKCVGVAKDLLPEGEWHCPECLMEKDDGLGRLSKPFRGAEILGIDPHGRLYLGTCGYVLVSDSCDVDASFNYYNRNDINGVIEVLKLSYTSNSVIVNAVSMYCGVSIDAFNCISPVDNGTYPVRENALVLSKPLSTTKQYAISDDKMEGVEEENHRSPDNSCPERAHSPDLLMLNSTTSNPFAGLRCSDACSEISVEMTEAARSVHMSLQTGTDSFIDFSSPLQRIDTLKPTDLANGQERYTVFPDWGCMSLSTNRRKYDTSNQKHDPLGYVNCYIFSRIASSVAEELMSAASEIKEKEPVRSTEDIKSAQLKAILKKPVKSCWYASQKLSVDAQKENCGWCFSCQSSSGGECLFKVSGDRHLEGPKNRSVGLRSEKNKKSHLSSAMHLILSIEERLRSLLSGPWKMFPNYSECWRKAVMKASDTASLKHQLLVLEANLRIVALSAEWLKPVDYTHTVRSASHILINSTHVSTNHCGRRQAKRSASITELNLDLHAGMTSGVHWWRGGRLSRQVFQWDMLPRSLVCKGARQAGCRKIPSIFYPDGSELAKRSKCVAWRAAVEMSKSVAQLIYQIKDFESNIQWIELSNTDLFPQVTKESKKLRKPLKKVTICRKSTDGIHVKYLLDFGKRQNIPPIVTKHGIMHEESSGGRQKYWLHETHVPLNLLKAYEDKQLNRLLKKSNAGHIIGKGNKHKMKKLSRSKGLSHLLSRETQSQLCAQCNKDVLIREAMNCQCCNGFFHRKHIKVPKGATTANYTCHSCKHRKGLDLKAQGRKVVSKRRKIFTVNQLQEAPKKGKPVRVKSKKKPPRAKKGNLVKSRKRKSKRSANPVGSCKRKRTIKHYSYWLNGLRWTHDTVGELGKDFRQRKILLPSEDIQDHLQQPVCCLCHEDYNHEVIYICCDCCGDWFHGNVFFLTLENIKNLIGFKCHKCRMKGLPTCPFSRSAATVDVELNGEQHAGARTIDVEHQNVEEKLHCSTFGGFMPVFEEDNHVVEEQKEVGFAHPKGELVPYRRTRTTNGHTNMQSRQNSEANVASLKHENGVTLVVASEKIEVLAIPQLFAGTLGENAESNPQTILPTHQLLNIEGGKI